VNERDALAHTDCSDMFRKFFFLKKKAGRERMTNSCKASSIAPAMTFS
jgi:hypothetical protein